MDCHGEQGSILSLGRLSRVTCFAVACFENCYGDHALRSCVWYVLMFGLEA